MSILRNRRFWQVVGVVGAYAAYRTVVGRARRYDFRNRVVLITGGSRGLGLVLARQLADEGARLAICSRHGDELERAAWELRSRGADVVSSVCDVTNPDDVAALFDATRRRLGPIDVLMNNAGIIQVGPLEAMTDADFEEALAVHFWAPLRTMELALPEMRRRGHGRIVNIASIGGKLSPPHLLPYSASKFALVGLSQGYRAELVKDGVYVTTVCPGLMRTGSHWHALFKGQHRLEHAWFSLAASAPLGAINAERAARQIINACRDGRAELTISWPAKIAARLNALAPELAADLNAAVVRLLPAPGGIGARSREGSESTSPWSPSLVTLLGDRAALRNNELR